MPPRPTPRTRPATPQDLPILAALEQSSMPDPWSPAAVASELDQPDSLVLVAVDPDADAPVAYASYRHAAEEAELLRLAVDPARRREGLATELLAAGDEALAAAGCVACFLEVRADNAPAIAFYERAGFHRIGRRPGYYRSGGGGSVDAIVYARAIVTSGL